MLYPNRKLNIVNSPKLAYNMNYDVSKMYLSSVIIVAKKNGCYSKNNP